MNPLSTRKRKTIHPCDGCGLHQDRCLCSLIPSLETRTRLCLVIHHRETKRTTNTGSLAVKALINSELRIRGVESNPLSLTDVAEDTTYQNLLLYPAANAVELSDRFIADLIAKDQRPVRLIVPDGNWRQASKVHIRHQELNQVTRVTISRPNLAAEHLRAEHFPEGMSTLEAIAEAYRIIEGRAIGEELAALYRLKLSRTLEGRPRPKR